MPGMDTAIKLLSGTSENRLFLQEFSHPSQQHHFLCNTMQSSQLIQEFRSHSSLSSLSTLTSAAKQFIALFFIHSNQFNTADQVKFVVVVIN